MMSSGFQSVTSRATMGVQILEKGEEECEGTPAAGADDGQAAGEAPARPAESSARRQPERPAAGPGENRRRFA